MAKKLVPSDFKTHLIDQIIESVTERANTAYYAFVGDHETVASSEEEINQPTETFRNTNTNVYRNMIFGKRITADDMSFVINRTDWTAGTTYAMYDDQKIDIQDTNFYVMVDENSFKHVYKCLSNNNDSPSTDKPLYKNAKYEADLFSAGDDYYETSDGYQWKYMYSIASSTFDKFATEKYIPVVSNTVVESNAQEGAIDVIKVTDSGKNYENHLKSQFLRADIGRITKTLIEGDTIEADPADSTGASHFDATKASLCYRIAPTVDSRDMTTDFYANTIIYLTSGTGEGQFKKVDKSAYVSEVGGVVIQIEDQFNTLPDETTTYEITPFVQIIGDGNQTVNAVARAIINANASDSVHKIEMLKTGADYSFATAEVLAGNPRTVDGTAVDIQQATVRPILSPQGGHGANTIIEFGAKRLSFYMKFDGGESNLVQPTNTFSQFGIIRDPKFANVAIYTADRTGEFIEGETIHQFTKIIIGSEARFTSNSALAASIQDTTTTVDAKYDQHFAVGDYIFMTKTGSAEKHFLTTVAIGSTGNTINLAEAPPWASTETRTDADVTVYYIHKEAEGLVKSAAPIGGNPALLVNQCVPEFRKEHQIYGVTSRNIATVKGVDINNRIGDVEADFQFADFNQMIKITAASLSGTFTEDETITQGTNATGQLHSAVTEGGGTTISMTNITGAFATVGQLEGQVSGAILDQTGDNALDIQYGDLDPNAGAILYLQNDIPVDRDDDQTEEIRVILEF
jgi:hypothetical protein